jgi:hypothetical protein
MAKTAGRDKPGGQGKDRQSVLLVRCLERRRSVPAAIQFGGISNG